MSERRSADAVLLSNEHFHDRKTVAAKRLQAVIEFVNSNDKCRSQQVLAYFGENLKHRCGKCDVCTQRNRLNLTDIEFGSIKQEVYDLLKIRPYPLYELVSMIRSYPEEKTLMAVRWLLDNRILIKDSTERLTIRKQMDFN